MSAASEYLEGEIIDGWTVEERIKSYPGATGGYFSNSYIVTKDGEKAFLKAMDLHGAIIKGLNEIQRVVTQYNFEKNLLTLCREKNLSKIVRLITDGEYIIQKLPGGASNALNKVYYLIFELADGDIRRELKFNGGADNAWKANVLHQIAVALTQLHINKIAHQDLKPSNVLSFNHDKTCKLADLGRSSSMHISAPTDVALFPGDFNYAPPEYLYGHVPGDFHDRRFGSDAYLLGSMISFLFTGLSALTMTLEKVDDAFKPNKWSGDYSDVLPYLISAHTSATSELKHYLPSGFQNEFSDIYFQLCHPDPYTRGHPKSRKQVGRPIGLDRYVSKFNLLTRQLQYKIRISN